MCATGRAPCARASVTAYPCVRVRVGLRVRVSFGGRVSEWVHGSECFVCVHVRARGFRDVPRAWGARERSTAMFAPGPSASRPARMHPLDSTPPALTEQVVYEACLADRVLPHEQHEGLGVCGAASRRRHRGKGLSRERSTFGGKMRNALEQGQCSARDRFGLCGRSLSSCCRQIARSGERCDSAMAMEGWLTSSLQISELDAAQTFGYHCYNSSSQIDTQLASIPINSPAIYRSWLLKPM